MILETDSIVLDTSILVELIRGRAIGRRVDEDHKLRERTERPIISVVPVGELKSLARKLGWGAPSQRRLDDLIGELTVIHLEQGDVIERYAELDHFSERLARPAKRMGKNDLWIAATAVAAGAYLLTSDRDFDHLTPHVRIVRVDPNTGATIP